jgi:hypothetical protein
MLESGVCKPMGYSPIIGQQKEPLAVPIESAYRVYPRNRNIIGQSGSTEIVRELAEDVIRFVELEVAMEFFRGGATRRSSRHGKSNLVRVSKRDVSVFRDHSVSRDAIC